MIRKETEFFSDKSAKEILKYLEDYAMTKGIIHKVSKKKYQVKFQYEGDMDPIILKIKILKFKDHNNIDVIRVNGDGIVFFNHFNDLKEYILSYNDS